MFNFVSDASAVSSSTGLDRDESLKGWTVLFDTDTWVLVVPGA